MLDAVEWNRARHGKEQTREIQSALKKIGFEVSADGLWGPQTVLAVTQFQEDNGLVADGKVGHQTLQRLQAGNGSVVRHDALTIDVLNKTMVSTILHESGGRFGALNLDYEYEGWFDLPRKVNGKSIPPAERAKQPNHKPHNFSKFKPGSPGVHIGLSYGVIQFTQEGGALGRVIEEAAKAANYLGTIEELHKVFGGENEFEELEEVVTRSRPTKNGSPIRVAGFRDAGLRSPRVQPVGGEDLWKGKWIDRFKVASKLECIRKAQLIVAATDYYLPALSLVGKYCGETPSFEDIAVAFDMCVQFGPSRANSIWKKSGGEVIHAATVVSKLSKNDAARRLSIMSRVDELEVITLEAIKLAATEKTMTDLVLQLKL